MSMEDECDLVPEDDAIIGRAFKRSLAAFAVIAVIVLVALWLRRPETHDVIIEEAEILGPQTLQESVASLPPAVRFVDVGDGAGIDFVHVNGAYGDRLLPETMGSGVAVFDFDNDGDNDLFFVNARYWPWREYDGESPAKSALYRNDGNWKFVNVSEKMGLNLQLYGTGVSAADFDADGYVDLYVAALGTNRLLRNIDGRTFEDVTDTAGVGGAADSWTSSAAFFDYDRDGDLDLFAANYVQWSREIDFEVDYRLTGIGRAYGPPTNYAGTNSYLFRNDGNGRFSDQSGLVHVSNPATGLPMGKGLAVLPLDINGDGWTDIAVANDTVRNFLFINNEGMGFSESGTEFGFAFDNSGSATGAMGMDAARYNNNGDMAIAIANFANEMTSFYVSQEGVGLFTDEAIVAGIGPTSRQALSFGLFFFDYDLDGRLDLFQTNGHVEDEINAVQPSQHYEQASQLYWNCGLDCPRNFVYVDSATVGDLALPVVGRGAAYGDLDGDGDPDIVITQAGRKPLVLRNDQDLGHNWLRVKLSGAGSEIGAIIELVAGGQSQIRHVQPARSYLSHVDPVAGFGLGTATEIDSLSVHWPDGKTRVVNDIRANETLVVSY